MAMRIFAPVKAAPGSRRRRRETGRETNRDVVRYWNNGAASRLLAMRLDPQTRQWVRCTPRVAQAFYGHRGTIPEAEMDTAGGDGGA